MSEATHHTPIAGLHHVTAIASDPQRNLDFYTESSGFASSSGRSTSTIREPTTFILETTSARPEPSSPFSIGRTRRADRSALARPR
jgi:catechol 2,3-dioxygenase-like lactoylglutathione lyase family enzyme